MWYTPLRRRFALVSAVIVEVIAIDRRGRGLEASSGTAGLGVPLGLVRQAYGRVSARSRLRRSRQRASPPAVDDQRVGQAAKLLVLRHEGAVPRRQNAPPFHVGTPRLATISLADPGLGAGNSRDHRTAPGPMLKGPAWADDRWEVYWDD